LQENSSPPDRNSNLRDSVGNGRANHPEDLRWVKEALRLMGRYNGGEDTPYIDRTLARAIEGYQRDRGLRRDGVLTPGGETECTLCVEISSLLRRAGR
jgi:Putative peptidoglycan binding domain